MTTPGYADLLALAAGGLLLAAVGIVWRRELRSMVQLLAWQGLALAALPIVEGVHQRRRGSARHRRRGGRPAGRRLLPWLLGRAVGSQGMDRRESTPVLNTTASLLSVAVLTVMAFAISQPLVDLEPTAATRAVPAAFAVILIAIFVMVVPAPGALAGRRLPDARQRHRRGGVPDHRRGADHRRARCLARRPLRGPHPRRTDRAGAASLRRHRPRPAQGAAGLMTTLLLLLPVLAPSAAAALTALLGWRPAHGVGHRAGGRRRAGLRDHPGCARGVALRTSVRAICCGPTR